MRKRKKRSKKKSDNSRPYFESNVSFPAVYHLGRNGHVTTTPPQDSPLLERTTEQDSMTMTHMIYNNLLSNNEKQSDVSKDVDKLLFGKKVCQICTYDLKKKFFFIKTEKCINPKCENYYKRKGKKNG